MAAVATAVVIAIACYGKAGSARLQAAQDRPPIDVRAIPIAAWLEAGEVAEIPWRVIVRPAVLRMDQRLEVPYEVRIAGKDLNRSGKNHQLVFMSRISTSDGKWLNEPAVLRHEVNEELAKNVETRFMMRVSVKPGDFLLWLILYDQVTGKHNVAKRRMEIDGIRNDPLPNSYSRIPVVEFPEVRDASDPVGYRSRLSLPIENSQPLRVEIISTLSQPEQWVTRGRMRVLRNRVPNIVGALTALSQLEMTRGTLSITGLDLMRRQLTFRQESARGLDLKSLLEALEKAASPVVDVNTLAGRRSNGAFFRDYLHARLLVESAPDDPKRIFIVLSESLLFPSGSDLKAVNFEGDCHCLIYHLRFRHTIGDTFDDLAKFMKPLRPRTFNLLTSMELRKAIAEILSDLNAL
jgi:hypothetical protein